MCLFSANHISHQLVITTHDDGRRDVSLIENHTCNWFYLRGFWISALGHVTIDVRIDLWYQMIKD